MTKETGIVNIRGRAYKTVALRVTEFRAGHSIDDGWSIIAEPFFEGDIVRVRVQVISPMNVVVAQDWAEEKRGSTLINKTSALENGITSAIGRALAACGFVGAEYASAEEVANAILQQGQTEGYTDDEVDSIFGPETQKEHAEVKESQDAKKAASFAKAMNELTIQMTEILSKLGEAEPSKEATMRMTRVLGTHGYTNLSEITKSKERHAVHDAWAETVEAARAFAEKQ